MNDTYQYSNAASGLADRGFQSCQKLLAAVDQAKKRIVNEFRDLVESHQTLFQAAVNEAEVLALQTAYPHLVFPSLAVEKVQVIAARQNRQQFLHRSRLVFAEAA
jgi:hypothetical protein